ncbi:MAG: hypothetical protein ACXWL2_02065 [Candidatus Chromulinivorax sp.]
MYYFLCIFLLGMSVLFGSDNHKSKSKLSDFISCPQGGSIPVTKPVLYENVSGAILKQVFNKKLVKNNVKKQINNN